MSFQEPGQWTKRWQGPSSVPSSGTPPRPGGGPGPEPGRASSDEGGVEGLREVVELVKDLSQETSTLIRQEFELAKAELSEKGKKAGIGAAMFGGAGVMGFLTAGAFTAFLILALSLLVAPWLAGLIVTAVYGAIAAVLAISGRQKVDEATPLVPGQTIEAAQHAKDTLQSAWRRGTR
jgi:hypothetical protein